MLAAGNPPDLVRDAGTDVTPYIASQGLALNLDSYFAQSTIIKESDIMPVNDVWKWDGKQQGQGSRYGIAYGATLLANSDGANAAYDSWDIGVTMSNSQFVSVSTSGWDAARQADGDLPVLTYLHLAPKSALIDKGVNVGLPYNGKAPDLGAFETSG